MANADSVTLGRIAAGDLMAEIYDTEGNMDVVVILDVTCWAVDDIIAALLTDVADDTPAEWLVLRLTTGGQLTWLLGQLMATGPTAAEPNTPFTSCEPVSSSNRFLLPEDDANLIWSSLACGNCVPAERDGCGLETAVDVKAGSFDGVVTATGTVKATDWFATTGSIWQAEEEAEGVVEATATARMAIMLFSNCCELTAWVLMLRSAWVWNSCASAFCDRTRFIAADRLLESKGLCGRSTGNCGRWLGNGSEDNVLTAGRDNPGHALSIDAVLDDCIGVLVTHVLVASGASGAEWLPDEVTRGAEAMISGTSPAHGITGAPVERWVTEAASDGRWFADACFWLANSCWTTAVTGSRDISDTLSMARKHTVPSGWAIRSKARWVGGALIAVRNGLCFELDLDEVTRHSEANVAVTRGPLLPDCSVVFVNLAAVDSWLSAAGLFRLLELVVVLSFITSRRRRDRTPEIKASSDTEGAGVEGWETLPELPTEDAASSALESSESLLCHASLAWNNI